MSVMNMISKRQEVLINDIRNILNNYNEGRIHETIVRVEETQGDTVRRLISERVDYYFESL